MRRRSRLVATTAAVASIALLASACGSGSGGSSSSSTEAGKTGGDVTVGSCQPQNPLIPGNTNETCGGNVVNFLFTGLVRYNTDTGDPELAAAESITSSDAQNYDVKLKSGMKFTDGTAVTAKSFVDAWNWVAYAPNAALDANPFFTPIEGFTDVNPSPPDGSDTAPAPTAKTMSGLKVVSDTEFTIKLSAPNSAFQTSLGYAAFAPLPESFYSDTKTFGRNPVGNGPFKFVSWTDNVDIKLAKNTDYFDADHSPKVDNVTYKLYQDQGAEYADLQANNVDFQQQVPTSVLTGDLYKSDLPDRNINKPVLTYQTLTFPLYDKEFQNADLRKAISLAIDRKTITEKIFNNTRTPATAYTVPSLPGYNADACGDNCTYNVDAAKAELAKAGGFSGTLNLGYNADGDHQAWIDAVCNSITNALGIKCNGAPVPTFAAFRATITAKQATSVFRTGWQYDYPAAQDGLEPLFRTGASSNDGGYSNKEVDSMFDKANQTVDPTESAKLYGEAEKVILDDMPAIPLWYVSQQSGWSDKVSNVKVDVFGILDITQITLK